MRFEVNMFWAQNYNAYRKDGDLTREGVKNVTKRKSPNTLDKNHIQSNLLLELNF